MSIRRVAIVTGGTRGIGLGIATALAKEACQLVLAGRRSSASVSGVLRKLEELGAAVHYVEGDLAERSVRDQLMCEALQRFGAVHILINNAGAGSRDRGVDMLNVDEDNFAWMLRTNLRSPYFLSQLVARHMVERRRADPTFRACIVNVSSISAETASITRGDYCISKAGLAMATKLWAARLAPEGIPVYEVRPGLILTDMTAAAKERYDALIEKGLLAEARWGLPADVGAAVALLVRGDLPYAPGQVLNIDGGLSWQRL